MEDRIASSFDEQPNAPDYIKDYGKQPGHFFYIQTVSGHTHVFDLSVVTSVEFSPHKEKCYGEEVGDAYIQGRNDMSFSVYMYRKEFNVLCEELFLSRKERP
jgi:hypothetical protein